MAEQTAVFNIVVTNIREEVPGVKTFFVAGADGGAMPYISGQFITLVFTHHGREERRSFSISSCAEMGEPLAFTVKRIDNGAYSRYLVDRVAVGSTLYTTGAAGMFTLPAEMGALAQVFFFAAGIGITPVVSLIKSLLVGSDKQVVLIYSNRSQDEVVFYNVLQALVKQYPERFQLELLYSTAFNLERARLSKSLLPVLLQEYARVPYGDMLFYLCGPFDYMRMVVYGLEEQGISNSYIRRENFNTNNRYTPRAEPPDKAAHVVTLTVNGSERSFEVHYPQTILQAAKANGISLPYSCETGRCGSCVARCTEGKVWLSYNEVLMPADLQKGLILTCVAHPINGDVRITVN
ncbi:MAG: iron-sulfur cluster-binding domain-containing protein [Bacteroidota bacterium]